jgi:L-fuconolactonase
MRIDAHHHLWDLGVRDQPWTHGLAGLRRSFDLTDLRPHLAAAGIDGTVVVQTITVPEETPELLALAADESLITGVVGWVDLTAPDVSERITALREGPGGGNLVGIRHQVQAEPDPRWLVRPEVLEGLRRLAEHDVAYDLLIIEEQFPAAIEAARAVPQLRFVLDHAGKPNIAGDGFGGWQPQLRALAELGNVACKLSGLVTEADHDHWQPADVEPYAREVIDAFGPDRVMYGSDWPVCEIAGGYRRVYELAAGVVADLDPAEQRLIFGETASHWYRLEGR